MFSLTGQGYAPKTTRPDPRPHHCGRCNSPNALITCACTCHTTPRV